MKECSFYSHIPENGLELGLTSWNSMNHMQWCGGAADNPRNRAWRALARRRFPQLETGREKRPTLRSIITRRITHTPSPEKATGMRTMTATIKEFLYSRC